MTGKLFLAGGGNGKQSFEVDRIFLRGVHKVLYIPVAWKNEDYEGCLGWFTNNMSKHKPVGIDMLTDLSKKISLEDYEAVYVGGGNTYRLLKKVKDSGFDRKLLEYYQRGGKVYGGSAGAIIWGHDISSASRGVSSDKNLVHLENISGIDILKGINIQCHYLDRQLSKERAYVKTTGLPVLAIPEESALLIENYRIKVIGTKPVTFISPERSIKYSPGEIIKL